MILLLLAITIAILVLLLPPKVSGSHELGFPEHEKGEEPTPREWAMYWSDYYRTNKALVDCIGLEESQWNATAQNKKSSAGGSFQFVDSTWIETQERAGIYGDKYNPKINAQLANYKMSQDGYRAWEVYTKGMCQ